MTCRNLFDMLGMVIVYFILQSTFQSCTLHQRYVFVRSWQFQMFPNNNHEIYFYYAILLKVIFKLIIVLRSSEWTRIPKAPFRPVQRIKIECKYSGRGGGGTLGVVKFEMSGLVYQKRALSERFTPRLAGAKLLQRFPDVIARTPFYWPVDLTFTSVQPDLK